MNPIKMVTRNLSLFKISSACSCSKAFGVMPCSLIKRNVTPSEPQLQKSGGHHASLRAGLHRCDASDRGEAWFYPFQRFGSVGDKCDRELATVKQFSLNS